MITVTVWHNVAADGHGRYTAMTGGYRPGDPVVRVFTYRADPAGGPEAVAEEAFGICNGHPRCPGDAEVARRSYGQGLRSLSFPGNPPCCSTSCCLHRRAVWPRFSWRWLGEAASSRVPAGYKEAARR
jgi:hypothetical protein